MVAAKKPKKFIPKKFKKSRIQRGGYLVVLGDNLPLAEVLDGTINIAPDGSHVDLTRVRFVTTDRDRLVLQGMVEGNLSKIKKNLDINTINKYKTINYYHPDSNLKSINARFLPFFIDQCCAEMSFRHLTPNLIKQNLQIARYLLESGADPLTPNSWHNDFEDSSTFERLINDENDGNHLLTYHLIKTFLDIKPELISQPDWIDRFRKTYPSYNKQLIKLINQADLNAGKSPNNYVILCDSNGRDTSEEVCKTQQFCRIIGDFDPLNREISQDFLNLTPVTVDQIYPKFSMTFLEKAIHNRDTTSVEKLLKLGADPSRQNADGVTMIQLATNNQSGNIWNLLRKYLDKRALNSNNAKNSKNNSKNTKNNSNSGICYNPSPISLESYDPNDTDLVSIRFPNKTSGWGKRGECITRSELTMYLQQELSSSRNTTSPPGSLMANWVGTDVENTGWGGSAGGKLYFRLPTTNSYITWSSLVQLIRQKGINTWYAHSIGQERIGNLWSIYGSSQNHGQKPGFAIYKLAPDMTGLLEADDEYLSKKNDWLIPLKSRFQYNSDIDEFIDKNINKLIKNSNGGSKNKKKTNSKKINH